MHSRFLIFLFSLAFFSDWFAGNARAQSQATIAWTPSSAAGLAGYYLAWGVKSRSYFATNICPATQASGVISNLNYGTVYFIAVAEFSSNGAVSPFSPEIIYTNSPPPAPPAAPPVAAASPGVAATPAALAGPPPPPLPSGDFVNNTPVASQSGGVAAVALPAAAQSPAAAISSGMTQAQVWGIPPALSLAMSNNHPCLAIAGTIGSTVVVQSTADLAAASWMAVTNILMTNPAPVSSSPAPGQPQDAIDLAYNPALQTVALPVPANAAVQHYRAVLACDYVILAGLVLSSKGYAARLIVVNMPGLTDDGCYVARASGFIHYSAHKSALQLIGSGSTIRQIATTLADFLDLDWTTASEFTYSNGVGQILATVVEADPPASDPVAGKAATGSIVINF